MQIKNEYNIKERSMFYLSKIFGGQLKAKKNYRSLKKCVVICILNFNLFIEDNNRVHRNFLFKDTKTNDALSDLMELHYIELPKLQQQIKEQSRDDLLTDWLLFLTIPESEVVTMLKKKVPEIKEAVSILDVLSKDKEAKQIYEMRERAMMNESTNLEGAREEARIEMIREMIKEMLKAGLELSIIEKISHMPKAEIEKIKHMMH